MAHTPNPGFAQVIEAALAVQRAGDVADILLIAGDASRPIGEFLGGKFAREQAANKGLPTSVWEFRLHYVHMEKWNIANHE